MSSYNQIRVQCLKSRAQLQNPISHTYNLSTCTIRPSDLKSNDFLFLQPKDLHVNIFLKRNVVLASFRLEPRAVTCKPRSKMVPWGAGAVRFAK